MLPQFLVFTGVFLIAIVAFMPSRKSAAASSLESPLTNLVMVAVMFVLILGLLFYANSVTGGALAAAIK